MARKAYDDLRALGLSHSQVMKRMSAKDRALTAQADKAQANAISNLKAGESFTGYTLGNANQAGGETTFTGQGNGQYSANVTKPASYIVEDGDTVDTIAQKNNVEPEAIATATGNELIPGTALDLTSLSSKLFGEAGAPEAGVQGDMPAGQPSMLGVLQKEGWNPEQALGRKEGLLTQPVASKQPTNPNDLQALDRGFVERQLTGGNVQLEDGSFERDQQQQSDYMGVPGRQFGGYTPADWARGDYYKSFSDQVRRAYEQNPELRMMDPQGPSRLLGMNLAEAQGQMEFIDAAAQENWAKPMAVNFLNLIPGNSTYIDENGQLGGIINNMDPETEQRMLDMGFLVPRGPSSGTGGGGIWGGGSSGGGGGRRSSYGGSGYGSQNQQYEDRRLALTTWRI